MEDKNSASAQKAERCSVEKFRSYLNTKQEPLPLEQLLTLAGRQQAEKVKFVNYLMNFFVEIRKPNGSKYKLGGLQCIRYGLNRFTIKFGLDYINDPYFEKVTKLWDQVTSQLDAEGLSEVSHHEPLSETDLKLAYYWCNADSDDPDRLQKRVFMDLVMSLGHLKKCNLAELTSAHFTVRKIDSVHHIYINRKTGPRRDMKSFECLLSETQSQMYCPVKPFLKYLSKLDPKAERFFCKSIPPNERRNSMVWYYEQRLGGSKIGEFMKDISNRAGLSRSYTNHCLRVTNLPTFSENCDNSSLPPVTKSELVAPKVENDSALKIEKIFDFIDLLDDDDDDDHNDDNNNNNNDALSEHFVGGNGPTREHPDPLPVRPMNMLQSTAGYAEAGPSNQGYSGKPENSRRKKIATATVSSETVLIPDDSPPQPTAPKLQKKQLDDRRFDERRFDEQRFQERRFENRRFEERRQMAAAQSAQVAAPPLQVPSQMQVQQHLQVSAPPPAPVQTAPRQVQVLAPPVQVTVAKPKPVEKPRPREKRIFVVADHQRCVMSNLASLWKSGKLCDAGIGNGSSTVMVHKVVLSAVCPKLLSVFSTDILSHKFLQVNFPEEVSTEALNAFAEYMYNGILDLDRDILEQLKIIAKRLDMKEFEQLCDSHLPNHMHQTASAAVASFSNVPLIQTTMPIPPMTSSLPSLGSTISTSMHSAPSITTQVIDVKQEISEAELAQVKKDTAAVFGQESEVSSLAPNKSGNAAGFVISPSIKTEPVGPEDDKYGHLSSSSSNQAFTSTASSSSVVPTAASTSIASVPASSTEFAIPFSEATDVKSTRLKVTHSYDPPLVSDLSPVSCIVETVCSQSSPMNEDSSKPLNRLAVSTTSTDGLSTSTGNEAVYPVGLFTAGGDNLPLLTTQTVGVKTIDLYKTDLT